MAKMFAPIPPKKICNFSQEKKNFIRKFLECQSAQIYVFLLSTREVFIIKLLSQNHKSALFWLIFFFSKNPKIPKKFLIGKISLPSPFLLKSVCEKRLGHIVTNKFTKLRNKFEVSWKPIIVYYSITLWEENRGVAN